MRTPLSLLAALIVAVLAASPAVAHAKKKNVAKLAPAPATELVAPGERVVLAVLGSYRTGVSKDHVRHTAKTLVDVASEKGVDPFLALAIIRIESSGSNHARSSADARGLMQLRPFVGKALAKEAGIPWRGADTLHQPEVNVTLGIHYLAQLTERYDGNVERALQAYSMGPTKLDSILARGKTAVRDYAITARWIADRYRTLAATHGDVEPGLSRFEVALARFEREIGGKPKQAYALALGDAKKASKSWNRTSPPRGTSTVARVSDPAEDAGGGDVTASAHRQTIAPLAANR